MATYRLPKTKKTLRIPEYDPPCMTPGQINKALDRLMAVRSRVTSEFIAADRGDERPSEIRTKTDPLALVHRAVEAAWDNVMHEVHYRAGPHVSWMPSGRGFGPRRACVTPLGRARRR